MRVRRGRRRRNVLLYMSLCLLFVVCAPVGVKAQENQDSYLEELTGQVDFSGLDELVEMNLLQSTDEKISFSDIVTEFLANGIGGFDYTLLLEWLRDALFYELNANRKLLIEVVLLAIGFSILKNFAGAFRSAYIADLCFLMVYCVLGVMLLQSFSTFGSIVTETMNNSVDFMKALIPTLCITMVFSAGAGTSAGFYQIAFLVIYLIQWLFLKVLVPMIHIYVILELFNHFFEDEKFQNLVELLKGIICWAMKIAGISVLGLNVVQSLVSPAKDRLIGGGVSRAAAIIPGIGNAVNGVSELLLGSGIMIKNCVGAAALVILVLLGLMPMLKIACLAFFYKLAAACTEPVADKRIAGCLRGMAEGGILYLKLTGYGLVLFFLTIALTTAASSFIH